MQVCTVKNVVPLSVKINFCLSLLVLRIINQYQPICFFSPSTIHLAIFHSSYQFVSESPTLQSHASYVEQYLLHFQEKSLIPMSNIRYAHLIGLTRLRDSSQRLLLLQDHLHTR